MQTSGAPGSIKFTDDEGQEFDIGSLKGGHYEISMNDGVDNAVSISFDGASLDKLIKWAIHERATDTSGFHTT